MNDLLFSADCCNKNSMVTHAWSLIFNVVVNYMTYS